MIYLYYKIANRYWKGRSTKPHSQSLQYCILYAVCKCSKHARVEFEMFVPNMARLMCVINTFTPKMPLPVPSSDIFCKGLI